MALQFVAFCRRVGTLSLAGDAAMQVFAYEQAAEHYTRALGSLAYNIASLCYWHPTFPYKSPLTG